MEAPSGLRKAIGLLAALVGCVGLAVQLGCNNSNYNSPTGVAPPPQTPPVPPPTPAISGAQLTFIVDNPNGQAGEILFDGRSLWEGLLETNHSSGWYYYYDSLFQEVLTLDQAAVTPGVHTLTFRAPGRNAVDYIVSGWLDLTWTTGGAFRVARWQDQSAWVRTGREWNYQVVIPTSLDGLGG